MLDKYIVHICLDTSVEKYNLILLVQSAGRFVSHYSMYDVFPTYQESPVVVVASTNYYCQNLCQYLPHCRLSGCLFLEVTPRIRHNNLST